MPNITAVKVKNRRPSRHRKINRITVTGGEKSLHSANERKWVVTDRQCIRMSACLADRGTLAVTAPGPASGENVLILVMGTFLFTKGAKKRVVSLSERNFPPPFPGQLFAKNPYYLRFLLRLYLCT